MIKVHLLLSAIVIGACSASAIAQTRFKVAKDEHGWWLVSPSSAKFLSMGVCCVDSGTSFAEYDSGNPSYAAFRSYPNRSGWAQDVVKRLISWKFNTAGAWSDTASLNLVKTTPLDQTPILNLGALAGAPWKDLWSDETKNTFVSTAHSLIKPVAGDQTTIGYFSDNELGWWEGALFDWIWKSASNSGPRVHFVAQLRKGYAGWADVSRDFVTVHANSFDDLLGTGRLYLRPGGAGMKVVQSYVEVLADRYYELCRDTIKAQDPAALFLGDRYISNFYPEVARAAGKYVDVLSTNLNGDWNDGTFARFYLSNLENSCGKPILISEYYESATENGSGNKNSSSGFPVVATQEERADRVDLTTKFLLTQPYVVGAHWFQYYDEPQNGRGDGENYDFGLVDTSNREYPKLTAAFAALDPIALHTKGAPQPIDATGGIPNAPEKPEMLENWSRNRGYIPPVTDSGRADLYTCYSADSIYVAVYWNEDRFAEAFYENGQIPAADYPQIHLRIGKSYTTVAVPPKGAAVVTGDGKVIRSNTGVRNEIIVKLPSSALGKAPFAASQSIALDVGLATRARAYFGRWKGNYTLGTGG